MDIGFAFFGIVGALAVGAASPGPSFVLVARTAIAVSRRDGLAAALGMGVGGVMFGGLALLGLTALLTQVEWLHLGLKLLGGGYLLYLAFRLWRGAAEPIRMNGAAAGQRAGLAGSFWLGLATQLSNPKTAVVYASIFAALLPPAPPAWIYAALPAAILGIECGWYAIVALAFSAERPRAAYLRSKTWLDRAAGAVMGMLGVRLLADSAR